MKITSDRRRVLLIGWDAADWKMIHPLMDRGLLPNVKRLVETGVMSQLRTLSPVLSPMLWTSIATGKRPFKHGIYGFSEPTADGQGVQPVSNLSRNTKAIWNILNQCGKRCLVVGWWPSHPAEPIDGVMVSNHYQRAPKATDPVWPLMEGTIHPPELVEELKELRFHPLELNADELLPFVPQAHLVDQDKDRRLSTILHTIADCTTFQSCSTHLLETQPWDFAAIYFDAIDHFCHGFMKYHPPRRPFVSETDFDIYRHVVSMAYVYHDMMLGRLLELAGEEATVILMSDHGFHPDHLRPEAIPIEPAGPAIEHRDYGVFVMSGPGIREDVLIHGAGLLDVVPTLLTLFNLPVGEDMDGRPLLDAFEEAPVVSSIPSWDDVSGPHPDGQHASGTTLPADTARETMEQLVALGYIERPPENQDEAVAKTQRELDYNLALSYIDAEMHGEAAPLLAALYLRYPLEFRFGMRLAICLYSLGMSEDLQRLLASLNKHWRQAAERAGLRLAQIRRIAKERQINAGLSVEAKGHDSDMQGDRGEDTDSSKDDLFNPAEWYVIRQLRAIARGNPQVLDYLAGIAAIQKGEYEAALKFLKSVDTGTPGFFIHLGNAHLELNHLKEAREKFDKVLQLDPHHPNGHIGLARCFLESGDHQAALEASKTALSLNFHSPVGHYYCGIARFRTEDSEGAMRSFHQALTQNPNFPEAHIWLALMYRKLGARDRSQEHRQRAAAIRKELRHSNQFRMLPELPDLDDAVVDANLPQFPHPKSSDLLPPLAMRRSAGSPAETHERLPKIIVVSGLPRSGTSMMMQMLVEAGLPAYTDAIRKPDESNPRGFFEHEKVKRLAMDNHWLDEVEGRVVKVVSPLIPFLPQGRNYRVLVMERDVKEIVASQAKMLKRMHQSGGSLSERQLQTLLQNQHSQMVRTLQHHDVPFLRVNYHKVLADPESAAHSIIEFLETELDANKMMEAVDPSLRGEGK